MSSTVLVIVVPLSVDTNALFCFPVDFKGAFWLEVFNEVFGVFAVCVFEFKSQLLPGQRGCYLCCVWTIPLCLALVVVSCFLQVCLHKEHSTGGSDIYDKFLLIYLENWMPNELTSSLCNIRYNNRKHELFCWRIPGEPGSVSWILSGSSIASNCL